jgi:pimeloyl-ACP methyl ester carboxylesterase
MQKRILSLLILISHFHFPHSIAETQNDPEIKAGNTNPAVMDKSSFRSARTKIGRFEVKDSSFFITTAQNHKLFVRTQIIQGSGRQRVSEKPTLFAIHGLGDDSSTFDLVADQVLRSGIHVVRYDQYGHGQSAYASILAGESIPKQVKPEALANDAYDIAQFLKLKNIIAMGHSMGGPIAIELAAHKSLATKIIGLILLAPYVYRLDHALYHHQTSLSFDGFLDGNYQPIPWDLFYESIFVTKAKKINFDYFRKKFGLDTRDLTEPEKHVIDSLVEYAISVTRGLRSYYTAKQLEQLHPRLPIGLRVADKDQLLPTSLMKSLFKKMSEHLLDVRFHVDPIASHFYHHDNPSDVIEQVNSLARQIGNKYYNLRKNGLLCRQVL